MQEERKGYASRINEWQEACGSLDLSQQFDKLKEEIMEVFEPIMLFNALKLDQLPNQDPDLTEHVGRECVDVAFVASGIVELMGHDFDDLMGQALNRVYVKYPPERIRELRAGGMSGAEALLTLKAEWNNNGGKPVTQELPPNTTLVLTS